MLDTLLKIVCCVDTLLVCLYRYLNLTHQMCVSQHPLFGVFYNTEIVYIAQHLLKCVQ